MPEENLNAQEIVERISSAYGVSSQRALAEALDVPANNISSWLQRDSIPYKAVVKCALDTDADLYWLVNGKFANANKESSVQLQGKSLYEEILATGGRPVLRRILDAYGFRMQKELGDLLDISSGTISTWVRREFFPGDVVVACALDTGVSLRWLATGKGEMFMQPAQTAADAGVHRIARYRLESGALKEAGRWALDDSLVTQNGADLVFIQGLNIGWLVDTSAQTLGNGRWFISIDGSLDVFDVVRLPGGKIHLTNTAADFECSISDVAPYGLVTLTLEKHL
ncbi:helix-turn-helix domain-containing protein [Pluralibacter gergoviae]|uniref:helix-turn-helix domain-containing protein n=1 Tax=Pluralibacter gergoviae TaxID=61647 RepID=UPI0008DC017C|nr:helix-turn-helix domain-containing protein [Pluralibacter gergoviae]EKW6621118.1 helix-turn-helix domain-containing protein [Pluralibacter gergoviae]ELC3076579.1 helix-turn-helix domain-containing protein [Pluralibacter gergoviae]OHY59694.1 repressor [Pluralibacter gergoviae]